MKRSALLFSLLSSHFEHLGVFLSVQAVAAVHTIFLLYLALTPLEEELIHFK